MDKIELLGGACFSHGPYTFYKAVRIGNGRVLRLGSFFLTKLWNDADLISVGELQLLWLDSRGPNQPLASLRLYFLPENTPDGRRDTHGEDEVLTISEKVVVRVHDLITWLSPSLEWSWGREVTYPPSPASSPGSSPRKYEPHLPQVLTDPGIDFSDVEKQQMDYESNSGSSKRPDGGSQPRVVVLSYPRYCRYRALLRRLEGAEPSWLCSSVAAALGGFTALPGTRVLFCRDTFDYPDLETHELLCNHLAPKLKGRPRRKRKKRSASPEESSNESEASVASTSRATSTPSSSATFALRPPPYGVRRSERKTSAEEKRFLNDIQNFMNSRGTPVGKMPLLGYKQIDLFLFYTKVQGLGGYDSVSTGRMWKSIYDDIGGNTSSTSAATITRRHYERLLLPYERHQRGEETKVRPAIGRRSKTISLTEETDFNQETGNVYPSQTPPSSGTPTSTTVTPPLQSILSSPFLPGDKPRPESAGKTSSLRSVRVKPERLKSLNTIIANSTPPVNQVSSPPPTSTTPNSGQSVLERQLNSPLISQQTTPTSLPVNTTDTSTISTLTPPPEKDMKEIKLDPKQTSLLAQGKENIPLFGEKPIPPPRSPEVIDLETESDTSRDKIIIPSLKKRKLEILREGGLEVTAVDLEARPTVIQPTATSPSNSSPTPKAKPEEKTAPNPSLVNTTTTMPKLISLTVTPDIGHMLPTTHDGQNAHAQLRSQTQQSLSKHHANNNASTNHSNNHHNVVGSRVINLGSKNNATLLQLYANATVVSSAATDSTNHRFVPPAVPNGTVAPPKVTQSRSIFTHNEKMVYGNPKDILMPQKHPTLSTPRPRNIVVSHAPGVLDLTQRAGGKPTFTRPSLEIVRVPVVPRPNPINLDLRNAAKDKHEPSQASKKNSFSYPNMLDSRTMVSNNLEITLVNPKQKSQHPSHSRNNSVRRQTNGKYPSRTDSLSPYTHRKPNHTVIPIIPSIPNVPNLNHINNVSFTRTQQQQLAVERRKSETSKEQRRLSESERSAAYQQQDAASQKQTDVGRRHTLPNVSSSYAPQLAPYATFLSQNPNAGKFLPMLDPMIYSSFYNGLFPTSVPPSATFMPPEMSALYKELFAAQPRLAMNGQHQPAVPTSK